MSRLGIFIADGCEEVEALTVVDIVRRAKLEIDMISINGTKQVTSSRNVTFMTDTTKEEADFSAYDGIILPGGMPGTVHLGEDDTVSQVIREFAKEGKLVAAICAAPSVLGQAGILNGKKAACHPGFEEKLTGVTGSHLDQILFMMRKKGMKRIDYKAVLTDTNSQWTVPELFKELEKEHAAMHQS